MPTIEALVKAAVLRADLETVDKHFGEIGISDMTGIAHLKMALVALAILSDFELEARPSYKDNQAPAAIAKPLLKNLEFAKYLRNKFIGHIHPELISKALEWSPILRRAVHDVADPKVMLMVNLWLLETAINTYVVEEDGPSKLFDSETDVMYPPDWQRFLDFLEITVRGGIEYLRAYHDAWAPLALPAKDEPFDLELALKAGQTRFKYLAKG